MSLAYTDTEPQPLADDPQVYRTKRIKSKDRLTLYKWVSEQAKDTADRKTKNRTQTRAERERNKRKLAKLMKVSSKVLASKAYKKIRCPIIGCVETPINSCSEVKRHFGAHLPNNLLPFKCKHDGCGYAVYQHSNFKTHENTHLCGRQFTCDMEYCENGETRTCQFHVSTVPKLHVHQKGLWHPRHKNTPPSTQPAPRAAGTDADDRGSSSSPSSSSSFIQLTSPTSTRATSLPSTATPVLSLKTLPPGTYAGGVTGCLSLDRRDYASYLYYGQAPHTSSKYYEF